MSEITDREIKRNCFKLNNGYILKEITNDLDECSFSGGVYVKASMRCV